MIAADGFDADVAVIGGGPAGYSAALRCAEHGLATAMFERGAVGGTCLNVGCIPSKALIHAADAYHSLGATPGGLAAMGITAGDLRLDLAATMRWKDGLVDRLRGDVERMLAQGRIDAVRGEAEIIDAQTIRTVAPGGARTVTARSLIIATGSQPVELPHMPFGERVLSSSDVLALDHLPRRLAVVGGGYIGLELGTALRKLGAEVTVVEMASRVLPLFDAALVRPVVRRLAKLGVEVFVDSTAIALGDGVIVVERSDGTRVDIAADEVLVTVGRRSAIESLGLERLGLALHEGAIAIDGQCRTSVRNVYAIGDVTGEPMLAHRGIAQGELAADNIAGAARDWDHRAIPSVCFTDPQVCAVGLSPNDPELVDAGDRVVVGQALFRANGRALTLTDSEGFVRVVADRPTGVILGIQAVGPSASELAAVASVAVELATTLDDLGAAMIAHPTLAETLGNAVAAARRAADSGNDESELDLVPIDGR